MPISAIQRCFINWHEANGHRVLVPVRRMSRTRQYLRMGFPSLGLDNTLYVELGSSEITVYAAMEGECWDLLVSFDLVVPKRVVGGWVCCHCVSGATHTGHTPKLYSSRDDLWRDHLFEEFLGWINEKLARSERLGFYRFGEGATAAYLLPVDGHMARETSPSHTFALKHGLAPLAVDEQGHRTLT